MFSDDVGIFEKNAFETALTQGTRADGSDLAAFLDSAFAHMNTAPGERTGAARGWSRLPYVNGSLFDEESPVPVLDGRCRRHLLDCARLDWREINPDIFGSMLQAVVDPALRGELGMHYTSPANIMKVLEPILLDGLRAELEGAGGNRDRLRALNVIRNPFGPLAYHVDPGTSRVFQGAPSHGNGADYLAHDSPVNLEVINEGTTGCRPAPGHCMPGRNPGALASR